MLERDVCYSPTLTREVSTFVYRDSPEFFEDPFFWRHADPTAVRALSDPERQAQVRASVAAAAYERALPTARENLKRLSDDGVTIAMGTDTGPPGRSILLDGVPRAPAISPVRGGPPRPPAGYR